MKKIFLLIATLLALTTANSQNIGIGTTSPQSKLSIGANSQFQIDSVGNIKRINNIPAIFPSVQGSKQQTLINDGVGNLSWGYGLIPSGGIIMSTINDTNIVNAGFTLIGMKTDSIQLFNPGVNGWSTSISSIGAPSARMGHSIIWTGSEYIIWGGSSNTSNTTSLGDGFKYNPSTNVWSTISSTNAPSARSLHSAIWTGTEMIIWGGVNNNVTLLNNGSRYNPTSNTWTAISTTNAPSSRVQHSAIWTGSEMIIWGGGGSGYKNDGGRYNPTTNTWNTNVTTSNAPAARSGQSAIWTGTEMIIWGGYNSGTFPYNDGKRYNPATNTWGAVTSTINAPSFRAAHACVWTGSEMIIWGGISNSTFYNDGYTYNPLTNTWAANQITQINSPTIRGNVSGAWSGSEMFIWGGNNASNTLNNGGRLISGGSFGGKTAITYYYYRKN